MLKLTENDFKTVFGTTVLHIVKKLSSNIKHKYDQTSRDENYNVWNENTLHRINSRLQRLVNLKTYK